MTQVVTNLPAVQEPWVQPLDRGDPLEGEWQPTQCSWTEEPAGYHPQRLKELDMEQQTGSK